MNSGLFLIKLRHENGRNGRKQHNIINHMLHHENG